MKLAELLSEVAVEGQVHGSLMESDITGLVYDSRQVSGCNLFFAFAGAKADGRQFAAEAMERGAVAVVSDQAAPDEFTRAHPGRWIQVRHGRQALALMARKFYRASAERIALTGATGTNGKTTTCILTDTILRTAGHTTALLGTIHYHVAGVSRKAVNTTPESVDIYRVLEELAGAGGTHATMEVSSHALALGRVHGFRFHTAIFTNLTRDHLDFHKGGMEEYFAAKRGLFAGQEAPAPRWAVLNADDEWSRKIPVEEAGSTIWYGLRARAALRAEHVEATFEGLRFEVSWEGERVRMESPLVGRMNVYNILAACGAGLSHGLSLDRIAEGIRACGAVPGRFERIEEGQPFLVVVDYAHTDDALRNAIGAARGLHPRRLITVFGCGGDRDRAKRPLMGQAAGELSDYVVLTSDNPRSEDPLTIINDALVGLRRTDVEHRIEPDRGKAIAIAIGQAGAGDIVLIAGKGHETYQVLKDRVIDFDDREVARGVLRESGFVRRTS